MSTPANVKKLFAEDDNPRIIYSGDWSTVSPIKPLEYGNTAHVTTQQGASATFRFQGIGVLFYITLPPVTGSRQARVDLIIKLDDEVISYQEDAPSTDKLLERHRLAVRILTHLVCMSSSLPTAVHPDSGIQRLCGSTELSGESQLLLRMFVLLRPAPPTPPP
ncbi:hypothetical protein BKA70DRAFT_532045 [Coprinopsis sp. MPI-PUGE-AT-0042]|nr:hypothetical protein BKA70DRAFT_532045 [Coprinopsis sp. MPI-PUGE-AT-0042]